MKLCAFTCYYAVSIINIVTFLLKISILSKLLPCNGRTLDFKLFYLAVVFCVHSLLTNDIDIIYDIEERVEMFATRDMWFL